MAPFTELSNQRLNTVNYKHDNCQVFRYTAVDMELWVSGFVLCTQVLVVILSFLFISTDKFSPKEFIKYHCMMVE